MPNLCDVTKVMFRGYFKGWMSIYFLKRHIGGLIWGQRENTFFVVTRKKNENMGMLGGSYVSHC